MTPMDNSVQQTLAVLRAALDRLPEDGGFPVPVPSVVPLEDIRPGLRIPRAASSTGARWTELAERVDAILVGRRVLVVGPRAGYDASVFAARHADRVLACDPTDSAALSGSRNGSAVEYVPSGWEALDPGRHGTFDIVHCSGLVHRVLEPMALLGTLHRMTAHDGTLLVESMMLADPTQSEFLRFIPDRHAGDPSWWFIPGRLAFRWMVHTAGFSVEAEFGEIEGPREGFPTVSGYLQAAKK
jgi:SAM-dependent methyltransferase